MFYCILSTALSVICPTDDSLRKKVARNMWAVMEYPSIFLEPSRLNKEALLVVAAHGQENCTPSLCWSLVSHACRTMRIMAFRSIHSNKGDVAEGSISVLVTYCHGQVVWLSSLALHLRYQVMLSIGF